MTKRLFHSQILLFLQILIISFFCLLTYSITCNFKQIQFATAQTDSPYSDIFKNLDSITNVLTQIDQLQKNSTETQQLAILHYNQLSEQFNALTQQTVQNEYLKNSIELKNKIILTNNKSLEFLNSIKDKLANTKKNELVLLKPYAEGYILLKTEITQHAGTSFLNYNAQTTLFLFSLFGFTISTLLFLTINVFFQKSQKNELFKTESQLKTFLNIINNMSEGVIVTNKYGFFTYYNQSALDIIGNNINDIHYESSIELLGFHNLDMKKVEKNNLPFYTALQKNILNDEEFFVQNVKNPDGLYISASNGFFTDQKGDTAGSVVVLKNITHKKQLEALWIKEKESAIEGSKKKSDFLASMSHEIRTPMNGIIGLTTLLNETPLNSEQKDYVGTVKRSAHALLSLINDILDHSKIEAGKVDLVPENFNLKLLIHDILENFKFVASEKNISVLCHYPQDLNENFMADGHRLRQILMNLMGNAVKFTQKGQVELKLDFIPINAGTKIKFQIIDSGAGMEPNEVEKLFQRFFQTKSGVKFGGTGLGLSISKQLVDLMGGTIGVLSTVNVGSTFWFELTLQNAQAESPVTTQLTLSNLENAFSGKVLIAEDNIVNQKVASQYLKKLGFEVAVANNGEEAVELFKNNSFDLIFMDCQMPVLNGYQATQKILELQSRQSKTVPIVALTAEGTSGEKTKCFAAGMNDFLNKPLVFEHLATLLKKYFKITSPVTENTNDSNTSEIFKLSSIMVGDQLLLEVLFEDYQVSSPELIQALQTAFKNKDTEALSAAAHTLKSASATLGASKVSAICQKLENFLPDSELFNLNPLIAQLEIEYSMSIDEIRSTIFEIKNTNMKNTQKVSA